MLKVDGYDIEISRGDTLVLRVSLSGYDLPVGTDAVFTIRQKISDAEPVIQKRFDASDEDVTIVLAPSETNIQPKTYFWDLRLQSPNEAGGYDVITPMEYAAFTILDVVGYDIGIGNDPAQNPDAPFLQILLEKTREATEAAYVAVEVANEAASNANQKAESISEAEAEAIEAAQNANEAANEARAAAEDVNEAAEKIQPIDDQKISQTNPWSSRQIVDALTLPFAVSGEWVECHPVPGDALAVAVDLPPMQTGEGEPSPQNIRPFVNPDAFVLRLTGYGALNPHEYHVALGMPMRGGMVDVTNGEARADFAQLKLDGSEAWTFYDHQTVGRSYVFMVIGDLNSVLTDQAFCSHYGRAEIASSNSNQGFDIVHSSTNKDRLLFRSAETATLAGWKAYLQQQHAAGTPVTVVYKPADPTSWEIQATDVRANNSPTFLTVMPTVETTGFSPMLHVQGRENMEYTIDALKRRISDLELLLLPSIDENA